jgi:hypothetical protein
MIHLSGVSVDIQIRRVMKNLSILIGPKINKYALFMNLSELSTSSIYWYYPNKIFTDRIIRIIVGVTVKKNLYIAYIYD